jgi:hypothetical protein
MNLLKTPHQKMLEETGTSPLPTPGMLNTPKQMLFQESGLLPKFADGGETDYNQYRSDRDDPKERRINTTFDKYNVAGTWTDENKYPAIKASYNDPKKRSWNFEGDKDKNYSISTEKNGIEPSLNHSPGYWGVGLKLTPADMHFANGSQVKQNLSPAQMKAAMIINKQVPPQQFNYAEGSSVNQPTTPELHPIIVDFLKNSGIVK